MWYNYTYLFLPRDVTALLLGFMLLMYTYKMTYRVIYYKKKKKTKERKSTTSSSRKTEKRLVG